MFDVTVIIPAYITKRDQVQWLDEAIQSGIDNKCPVIVFNDGSTVDLSSLVKKYTQILWVMDDKNTGAAYARNVAISYAETTFILPLDCDDMLVPGAVEMMLGLWDGRPVYPDVEKFGIVTTPHFELRDFDCDDLLKHIGPYSVNVLHTKDQWKSIGGYDESIEFYEDGHYNAKLMLKYCGVRCPHPLVRYRMHPTQRTRVYMNEEHIHARKVLKLIRRIEDMSCCGGRRKSSNNSAQPAGSESLMLLQSTKSKVTTQVTFAAGELDMPLTMGELVLARYVGGKGKGKHKYRGNRSGRTYARIKFGSLVYAHPDDTRPAGTPGESLLLRVVVKENNPVPRKTDVVVQKPSRTPTSFEGDRAPMELDVPDIQGMSIKEIKLLDMTEEMAEALLAQEKAGRNRKGALEYLSSVIG